MPQSDLDPDGDGEADDVKDMKEVLDPTQDIIYNQSGEATLSFYVFENLREPGYKEYPAEYSYPAGTLPEAYQCYKPLLARNEDTGEVIPATHIVVGAFLPMPTVSFTTPLARFISAAIRWMISMSNGITSTATG